MVDIDDSQKIICPICKTVYRFDDSLDGKRVLCDFCANKFKVWKTSGAIECRLSLECPNCQKGLLVAREHLGGKVACPSCEVTFVAQVFKPGKEFGSVIQSESPLGPLKDPLDTSETAYDILGLDIDADDSDVEKAFKLNFHSKGAVQARSTLKSSGKRVVENLTLYNKTTINRMHPSPLEDSEALYPENRAYTMLKLFEGKTSILLQVNML